MSIGCKMRGLGESTYYTKSLKPQLDEIAGSNPYTLEHEVGKRRLRIKIDADTDVIENITNTANQKAPKSNSVSMEWADGLPMTYTRVDYLESYAKNSSWIQTKLWSNKLNVDITASHHVAIGGTGNIVAGGSLSPTQYVISGNTGQSCGFTFYGNGDVFWSQLNPIEFSGAKWNAKIDFINMVVNFVSGSKSRTVKIVDRYSQFPTNPYFALFTVGSDNIKGRGPVNGSTQQVRIYNFSANYDGEKLVANYVPTLDPTGAPCMFDLVTRRPFYNSGSGDFLYPTSSTTYSLRRYTPEYAIQTPTGIRKLYHVPENYDGSIEDYARENNYKRLVEPECPNEEGKFYESKWNETDEELILEWIEVEPPVLEDEQLLTEEL